MINCEGKAILNPQNHRNLKLYDSDMNESIPTKPLEGIEQDNQTRKNNVKETKHKTIK